MDTGVTADSGRRGRKVRRGLATLLATGMAMTPLAVSAATSRADAWGTDYAVTMKLTADTTKELTDGRNYVKATGRADEHTWGDQVLLAFPLRSDAREAHYGTLRLAGGVAYTGAGPDVSWTRLRVNFETHLITAVVNGGSRAAVLRVKSSTYQRTTWGADSRTLTLTAAGAGSLNRAAAGTPFRAGDVFAGDSTGCGH